MSITPADTAPARTPWCDLYNCDGLTRAENNKRCEDTYYVVHAHACDEKRAAQAEAPTPPPTATEVYETVRARLLDGTGPALNAQGACVYRTRRNGTVRACAVGCLFTDDEYLPVLEGNGVINLFFEGLLPDRLADHLELLEKLQTLHDHANSWNEDGTLTDEALLKLELLRP